MTDRPARSGALWQALVPDGAEPPYAATAEWMADALGVDPARGLDEACARALLDAHGPNRIGTVRRVSLWRLVLDQFRGAVVWLLVAAAALSAWMGDLVEAGAILAVLLVNGVIGFVNEARARSSMAALARLTKAGARVRRGGEERRIDADDLVPGDVVVLEAGDLVPADLRLLEATDLQADESALTGESAPVAKGTDALHAGTGLADRTNMAWRGTALTRGSGLGLVTGTGGHTQIGEIAALVAGADAEATPLEARLDRLGRMLALGTVAMAGLVALIGLAAGRDPLEMLHTGIALAVAAVPEGMPIIATLALARGMWRMAERNVLVNRLSAVETLGSTSVLMTDKTGTLTENRMRVARLILPDRGIAPADAAEDPRGQRAALVMALCNDAVEGPEGGLGDPMELALLAAVRAAGQDPAGLRAAHPTLRAHAFDPETKLMATIHPDLVAVKGAPESVLAAVAAVWTPDGPVPVTDATRAELAASAEAAAAEGLRLLGLALREGETPEGADFDRLGFLGFVALADPARGDVRAAMEAFHIAGMRVVMVTGDHGATARRIALDTGLTDDPDAPVCQPDEIHAALEAGGAAREDLAACAIFARVPPRTKLDLVALHQSRDAVVAMTGDGVNDAPALKKADIGIAMGLRGTQVAAEAADIILRDDRFASIVHAVREGRIIYGNIRAFVRYLLACNISEIMVVGVAMAAGLPMPLLPLQILFLNLVTDVFPALALGFGEGPRDVMRQPPRPRSEPLLGAAGWAGVTAHAAMIAAGVLAVFLAVLEIAPAEANTAAFLTLCVAQLWFVLAMHDGAEPVWSSEITRNPRIWQAILLSIAIAGLGVVLAPVAEVLGLVVPSWPVLGLVAAGSLVPLAVAEAVARIRRRLR